MLGGKAMRRVSRRSLVAHKVRLVLTIVSVVLGTAFVAGSFVFTDTLKHTFNGIFTDADKGVDVRVDARKSSNPGVPVDLAGRIKAIPGVRAVQLEASASLVLIGKDGKRVSSGGAPSEGTLWNPPGESIKEPPTFVAGAVPSGPGDVVINEHAAKKSKLGVGDHTKVVLPTRGVVPVTVTGIYKTNTQTGGYVGVEFTESQGLQLFTDGTHVGAVSIAGHGVSEKVLRDRVAALLPGDLRAKTGDQVRKDDQNDVAKALSFINYFLLAFGVIALIVGTFIIYNTFTMIIAQRVRELALLRAIGAERRQVRSSVLFEATIIGVLGGAIGVAGGVGLAIGLRSLLDAMDVGLPSGALVLNTRTVIVALVVGTVVTLLSAYAPARRASKTPPVEAMREGFAPTHGSLRLRTILGVAFTGLGLVAAIGGATTSSDGSGALLIGLGLLVTGAGVLMLAPVLSRYIIGGIGRVVARPFGSVGRLARTNSVRNPRRTAATAFALTVGLMLVSGIAVIGASTKASINSLVDNDVRADYILQGTGGDVLLPTPAAEQVAKVPGVQSVTQLYDVETTINGDDAAGTGVDGPLPAVVKIDMRTGNGTLAGSNMLVSHTKAKDKHWKLGDHVTLATPGGASVTETITGIYNDSQLLGPWLVSGDTYRTLTPSSRYGDIVALVKAAPGTSASQLRAGIEKVTDPYYSVDVKNKQEFKGQQANQINGLLGLLYGLLGLAIVIAILGIINTLALSVVERRREIGMLRAVGMLRGQLRRTIYVESLLIAVFGAVLGLAIGLTFGALFTHRLRDQGLNVLQIPWTQAVLFLVIAAVVGVLAALWPAARAARTKPLEAITEA